MFNLILRWSIQYRYLVLSIYLVISIIGIASYQYLIIDAVPDITNVQVQINSKAEGYSPYEVEQRVTRPIELLLSGLPGLDYTRSLSRYGLSQVTVIFKDGVDIYFARELVSQKLQTSIQDLPSGVVPIMGPIATGLGEIFMFTLENSEDSKNKKTLQELREIQDWVVKPQLRTLPGVVDVNSIGGSSKQIVITPDLDKLRAFQLDFQDISIAVAKNNSNVGAGFIEQRGEQFLVRVPAQVNDLSEIKNILLAVHNDTPILIESVANVEIGSELRTGAATENGEEVVLGTVMMLMGENGRDVSNRVSQRVSEISSTLPNGVIIKPVYNRSNLINATLATVRTNLFEGALLVIAILFATLGNLRAALITALVIPLSMLMTVFGMVQGKMSANLMSLGALDFGLIVDGAVILVENCMTRFASAQKNLGRLLTKEERLTLVYEASSEVRQATMFGELIIMIVYIPILALTGIEGKMYHPMALTVLLALFAAFILSLTFVPAAVAIFISDKVQGHAVWFSVLQSKYRLILEYIISAPRKIILLTVVIFISSIFIFNRLGSEFIPSLDEGDIALHALRIPGTSLPQAVQMQHQLEGEIKKIPEVRHVFAKIGTAEIATDPMPPNVADGYIIFKDRSEWDNPKKSKKQLLAEVEEIVTKIPGNNYEFTQPIQMRFNELIAGVRSDVAVKIFGDDLQVLVEAGEKISGLLEKIPGASDVKVEQATGLPTVIVVPNREKISRLGLNVSDIQGVVKAAYAGEEVSKFFAGDRSFPIVIRLSEIDRQSVEAVSSLPIPLPINPEEHAEADYLKRIQIKNETLSKSYVMLKDLADVSVVEGANQITRENAKRRIVVTANVRNRDLGSFVEDAQANIRTNFKLPENYWLTWGGQYENLISAKKRLSLVVPLVLLSVFALIFLTFKSIRYSLLVFSGIPFAMSGGVFALWIRGIPFSISAAIGFIALSGVAVLNCLVLVSFAKKLIFEGQDLVSAVIDSAVARLRPVLMTALVASLGFIPMAISQGTGSEVQRPLATVVIGGIISSTILTLFVLPILLNIFCRNSQSTKEIE